MRGLISSGAVVVVVERTKIGHLQTVLLLPRVDSDIGTERFAAKTRGLKTVRSNHKSMFVCVLVNVYLRLNGTLLLSPFFGEIGIISGFGVRAIGANKCLYSERYCVMRC